MIIIEFRYEGELQKEPAVTQFKTDKEVIRFAAEKSIQFDGFKIIRINRYESDRLVPMEITASNGRITLEPLPQEMDDTEARMRMIAEHQRKAPPAPNPFLD